MSTRSCIMIKVRPEDKGKTFTFDKNKLPEGIKISNWSEYGEKGAKDKAKPVKVCADYLGIYCHSDGYPDGVGEVLKAAYNDYDKALNLIIGGFCSYVDVNAIRRYGNRKGEFWRWIKPIFGSTSSDVYSRIDSQYCYLFEDGQGWKLNSYKERDNKTLVAKEIFEGY